MRFAGAVIVVCSSLFGGVYLKQSGHGEWYWVSLMVAVLAPFLFGMEIGRPGSNQSSSALLHATS